MKILTILIPLFFLLGCQQDNPENIRAIKNQVESIRQEVIASQKEYEAIQAELEELKLETIDFDAEYAKGQEVIEQQDAQYNALLERWEKQADKMDKILEAQARQYDVKL